MSVPSVRSSDLRRQPTYPQEALKGTVEIVGEILGPVLPPEAWEAEAGRE